jgi:hypothetical protein
LACEDLVVGMIQLLYTKILLHDFILLFMLIDHKGE